MVELAVGVIAAALVVAAWEGAARSGMIAPQFLPSSV